MLLPRWRMPRVGVPGPAVAGVVLHRMLLGIVMLCVVSIIVFFATQVMPGDAARAVLGKNATPDRLAQVRALLHLDRPIYEQFWRWIAGLLSGDAGTSMVNGRRVSDIVYPRAVNSLALVTLTAVSGLPLAILAGTWSALRKGRPGDGLLSAMALTIAALPEFVVGIILVLLLSTTVFLLLPAVSLVPPGTSVFDDAVVLVLPVLTLCVVCFPYVYRMTRATLIEVLDSEYIEMARLKGIAERRIVFVHALPNALPPIIQVVAITLAYLSGGIVLVEFVFGYPGIGQGLLDAIMARDVPVIQLISLTLAATYIVLNIAADVAACSSRPN